MEWQKTPSGRFKIHIEKLFEEYFKTHPLRNHGDDNALLDIRNLIYQAVDALMQEPGIKKKYGASINALSLVTFESDSEVINPQSSWIPIPSDEDETRPPGITNEEFTEYTQQIDKAFTEERLYASGLHMKVVSLFREAFLTPATNKPFRGGIYTRLEFPVVVSESIRKQAVPCEICGENRVVDICHIIPRRIKEIHTIDNILFLCPTHHRFFDDCMLFKEEWDKIDWSRKSKKSQIYALKVVMPIHLIFWEKLQSGIFKKMDPWNMGFHDLYQEVKKEVEDPEGKTRKLSKKIPKVKNILKSR
jgi:hypothetical protein